MQPSRVLSRGCHWFSLLTDLQVAPDEVVENFEPVQRLKKIKSVVEEVKGVAKEAADKEAAMEF